MLSFAFFAGMLGFLALLVPVALHLTRPKQGDQVWFGSINILQPLVKAKRRNGIERWLLLVVRLFIVVVATLILAQSVWTSDERLATPVYLAVVTPNWLAYSSESQIDAMVKATDEFVILNHRFSTDLNTVVNTDEAPTRYWSRLAELDRIKPPHYQFVVYGINQLEPWEQEYRPVLSREIQWRLAEVEHVKTPMVSHQLATKLDTGLYSNQSEKRQFIAPYLLWLLVILWGLERWLAEFGFNRQNHQQGSVDES